MSRNNKFYPYYPKPLKGLTGAVWKVSFRGFRDRKEVVPLSYSSGGYGLWKILNWKYCCMKHQKDLELETKLIF